MKCYSGRFRRLGDQWWLIKDIKTKISKATLLKTYIHNSYLTTSVPQSLPPETVISGNAEIAAR
jgi:hypothetical protein